MTNGWRPPKTRIAVVTKNSGYVEYQPQIQQEGQWETLQGKCGTGKFYYVPREWDGTFSSAQKIINVYLSVLKANFDSEYQNKIKSVKYIKYP